MDLKSIIRNIPNYPKEGIIFRDITTVLKDSEALEYSINEIIDKLKDIEFDYIVGPESRGFIFGMPVAYKMKKAFIPIRKAGKLPCETVSKEYSLEYGTSVIEIHKDAFEKGAKIVLIDDLLATGGTCKAAAELIEDMGGEIKAMVFFIELENLNGRKLLENYNIDSVVKY